MSVLHRESGELNSDWAKSPVQPWSTAAVGRLQTSDSTPTSSGWRGILGSLRLVIFVSTNGIAEFLSGFFVVA